MKELAYWHSQWTMHWKAWTPKSGSDLEALIASASGNVVPLRSNAALSSTPGRRTRKRWLIAATAAAAVLAFVTVLWNPLSLLTGRSTYTTALGEQRGVALEDGSVVYLNNSEPRPRGVLEHGKRYLFAGRPGDIPGEA